MVNYAELNDIYLPPLGPSDFIAYASRSSETESSTERSVQCAGTRASRRLRDLNREPEQYSVNSGDRGGRDSHRGSASAVTYEEEMAAAVSVVTLPGHSLSPSQDGAVLSQTQTGHPSPQNGDSYGPPGKKLGSFLIGINSAKPTVQSSPTCPTLNADLEVTAALSGGGQTLSSEDNLLLTLSPSTVIAGSLTTSDVNSTSLLDSDRPTAYDES